MKRQMKMWTVLALVCLVTGVSAIQAFADATISGPGPFTIYQDTQLSGDVDCSTLTTGACITFENPGIQLDLNGFTIIGPNQTCTATLDVAGIDTNMQPHSEIEGPGKVEKFSDGVVVFKSNQSQVRRIVAIRNCSTGISGTYSDQVEIEDNIVLKNTVGIVFILGDQNDIQKNEAHGNVVGIDAAGVGNHIEENSVTTNGTGIYLFGGPSSAQVNENIVLNNNTDITDNGPGNTVTQKNVCEKGTGAAATVCHDDHNFPTPPWDIDIEVRAPQQQEQTEKEPDGNYDLKGEGTPTQPWYWQWTPAWAGALPLVLPPLTPPPLPLP
jgi:parallel beta-helix repeat protein